MVSINKFPVMNVTAFIGRVRKSYTYNASEKFLHNLESLLKVEYDIVRISDCNIGTCKGCKLFLDKGRELFHIRTTGINFC